MNIKYIRMTDEYTLRGYYKKNYLVWFGSDWRIELNDEELEFLKKCDGITSYDVDNLRESENDKLQYYISEGVVELLDKPNSLIKGRAYRQFNHKRRYAAIWSITGLCNLDCIHCMYGELHDEEHVSSLEDAKIIISRLADYGFERIGIFGGEPFVHPNFWEILDLIEAEGMEIGEIDTNGTFLSAENLERLKKYRVRPSLAISFDGIGTHDWMRNKEGLEALTLDAIKRACDKGFNVLASVNVNRKSRERMDETIECLSELGVRRIRFLPTSKTPKWMETTAQLGDLALSMDEMGELFTDIVEKHIDKIRAGIEMHLFTAFQLKAHTTGQELLHPFDKGENHYSIWCNVGNKGAFISTRGLVLLCKGFEFVAGLYGWDKPEYSLLHHTMDEIFELPFMKESCRYTANLVKECSEECQNCDKWERCYGGGCRGCAKKMQEFVYSKENICSPDMAMCALQKGGYIDRIAKILDEHKSY